ncbi:MAG: HAD family hydrolase [Victivallaceae bacterium]
MQAVFFDFDGTLLDTESDIRTAYSLTFQQFGLLAEQSNFKIGPSLPDTVRMLRPGAGEDEIARIIAAFSQNYDQSGFPATRCYDGVREMLDALHGSLPLFIATNKRLVPTELLLTKFGLAGYFERVYASDMQLPARRLSKLDMLRLGLDEHGLTPEACVIVGDTVSDIRGGRDAGMRTIAVRWGYAGPDEFDDPAPDRIAAAPAEIPDLLRKL